MPTLNFQGEEITSFDILGFGCTLQTHTRIYKDYYDKLALQQLNSSDEISVLQPEATIVDNNVENGYGIFTSFTETRVEMIY